MTVYIVGPDNELNDAIINATGLLYKAFMWKKEKEAQEKLLNEKQKRKEEELKKRLEAQKEFLKWRTEYLNQIEEQKRRKLFKELLGEQIPEISNLDNIFRVGDIQESINNALPKPAISRAVNDAFGIPQRRGFLGNYWENLKQNFAIQSPTPEVPQVKLKYEGGALSDLANKNPMIADSIKAQVYGVKLPEVKKKKKKYEAKVVEGNLFTFDPETGQWEKKGEVKKVIKETPQRMLVDTGDKKLLIDKKDGRVIKEYKVNKITSKASKQDSKLFARPSDVIAQLNRMSTKEVADPLTGQKTEVKRNLTYNDLKKVYKNGIWFKDKNGNAYEVVGVLNNYPVISTGNETYKVIGEKNGEPVIQVDINGKTFAVPVSKLRKLKRRYTVKSTVQMPDKNSYKTAEEYLQKWKKQ